MIAFYSLIDVIHVQKRLYLVFEYLDQDLKQYLTTLGNQMMDPDLIKVILFA